MTLLGVKAWLSTLETVYLSVFLMSHYKPLVPSIIYGVYARRSKISHKGGKCVTCRGLHILA